MTAIKIHGMPAAGGLLFISVSFFTAHLFADQKQVFEQSILPLLKESCLNCHSTAKQKGDLDLEKSDIHKEPHIWENVLDQIAMGEMPPKKEKPLAPDEKKQLVGWVRETLDQIALASAGDPGPVVLRRLSNMEYTYTIRDLTGVASLDPAKEFPVDGAAGEGFTNASAALVMSPALLTKYLDAAKEIANHAVLTPRGIHFSAGNSSRDWTDETLAKIRAIYLRHTAIAEGTQTTLQGIKLDTGTGSGRLPLARYLDALQGRAKSDGLSDKYLRILRDALTSTQPSVLLDPLRAKFRAKKLKATDIEPWQQVLWRFTSVGHIGKVNGPKAWQEPVTPLVSQHEMRVKLTGEKDVTLYLTTRDAGDGAEHDAVIWENPRLVAAGRPDLPISDLPALVKHLEEQRRKIMASTETCLAAIAAGKDDVDADLIAAWREYLGYGTTKLEPLLTKKLLSTPDYNFIKGWTGEQALSVLANSSGANVRTPGLMKAHSIATHPSPKLASVIAWRSPAAGTLRIRGDVADAHPECGNGVTWVLEVRRGNTSETLASGVTTGAKLLPMGPFENVRVMSGDVVALVIGPRDGNHVCDLTAINLTLHDGKTTWDLAKDVSPNILAGNPHGAWHFLSQPATIDTAPDLPAPMVEWRKTPTPALAAKVRQHLERDFPLNSPLLRAHLKNQTDPSIPTDLKAKAPSVIEVKIPAVLAKGMEFVVTGKLSADEGSVQMQVLTTNPATLKGIAAGKAESALTTGQWSDNNLRTQHSAPIIVNDNSAARRRFEAAFDDFRALFPIALCYTKIVPVDEVVTLTLFHREDDQLKRLMLDAAQIAEIDRLWDELRFVSESPLKQVDVFEQLYQFATQDAKPSAFEPMRQPIMKAADAFKKLLVDVEPQQVQAALDFATQAWRRPLSAAEQNELRALYQKLRQQELPHAAAVRILIARVLVAPAFLYRGEKAAPGPKAAPVNDTELATRLSYFLWSSAPDEELRALAVSGKLHDSLVAQAQRMLKSDKIRRLATEFGCQWLHVRDVATLDEKSERHFPTFLGLRSDMQEEVERFFVDLFQNNRSVLTLLDADHTFVNDALATHYGIANLKSEIRNPKSDDWQRIDYLRSKGRGGILGFAATLSKQAGASRTSPILRGTWLSEVILGDKLPIPPKGVPVLPEEAPAGLTERQLTERHTRDENCAGCHKRIDPFGYALEGFDAIGRARQADTKTILPDGTQVDGLTDLRTYLLTTRRDDFLRQFSRKLLGYALGRSVQLSDKPLIETMVKSDHRIATLIDLIVRSPQFREVRGKDYSMD
ncbi:MAG: DUF1592 domain-containing protein [Prosthecobacter sp.]|uniref:DUF1592 domain-containing protein n=1 Tax=Prosthecobacter sp. TaxID=1965333 RepID=UPI003903F073